MGGLDYKEIRKNIDDSLNYRNQYYLPFANRNLNWYKGLYETSASNDPDHIPYSENIAYSVIRTIVSTIYSQNPEFSFMIKGDVDQIASEIVGKPIELQRDKLEKLLEIATKIYLGELDANGVNKKAITYACVMKYGVTKMGYKVNVSNKIKDKLLRLIENDDKNLPDLLTNLNISDSPWLEHIDSRLVLLPVDAISIEKRKWECQIFYLSKDEAKAKYKKDLPVCNVEYFESREQSKQRAEKVKLYEYHSLDPENPKIYVLAEGHNGILEEKDHPLVDVTGNVKSLFQYIYFHDSLDSVYPMADLDIAAPQIREINRCIERRNNYINKISPIIALYGNWEDEQVEMLKSGEDLTIINNMSDTAKAAPIEYPAIPLDLYNNIQLIRNEILEVLGMTDYQMGGNTQNRKATEAQIMRESGIARINERAIAIEKFFFKQVDTFVEIIKKYSKSERLFSIVLGDERMTIPYSGMLMELSDMDITVIAGSTLAFNKQDKLRRAREVLQMLQVLGGSINASKAGMYFLREAGVVNPEQFLQDQTLALTPPGADGRTPSPAGLEPIAGTPSPTPMEMGELPNA